MKYASSIRYGGELIEAKDCDYESYKHLGLLCPECKDPVFLRAEGVRILKKKEVKIGAHFAHFPGKDPALMLACENRVKAYNESDLERLAKNTQNQRRKLFNRFFCKIIKEHLSLEYSWEFSNIVLQDLNNKNIVQKFARGYSDPDILSNSIAFIEEAITGSYSLSNLCHNNREIPQLVCRLAHFKNLAVNPDLNEAFRQSIISGLDLKMHKMVCIEALQFIATKGARPILEKLFSLALGHIVCDAQKGMIKVRKEIISTPNNILFDTTATMVDNYILTTPWVESFSKLSAKQANHPSQSKEFKNINQLVKF